MRRIVLYIGSFKMPDVNAAATRVLGIGKCLKDLGYEVVFQGNQFDMERPNEVCSFSTEGFRYLTRKKWSQAEYYTSVNYVFETINQLGRENVSAIIMYHPPALVALKLIKYCNQCGIKLITDVTEWYDIKRQLYSGHMWLRATDFYIRMYYANVKVKNVIAISSYLKNFYDKRGAKTVLVPILEFKKEHVNLKAKTDDVVRLCYCGSPSKKDLLLPIIKGVEKYIDKDSSKIQVDIIGTSLGEFQQVNDYSIPECYLNNITFYGRISHQDAIEHLKNCDFSFIIRPKLKYAIAGFPTKMVEAFASGVAVIACSNGDISQYVENGINGFLIDSNNIDKSLESALDKVFEMPRGQIDKMKISAYKTCQKYFDYRKYIDAIGNFMYEDRQ